LNVLFAADVYDTVKSVDNIKRVLGNKLFPTRGDDKDWQDGTSLRTQHWRAHDYKAVFAAQV
jgi:hypothetical protein